MPKLELRIPPLVVAFVFAIAMSVLSLLLPAASFPMPFRYPIALCIAIAGLAIAIAGVLAFRHHQTTVNPMTPSASSSVVTTGIYRYTRNPMYLGFLLVLLAFAVFLSNVMSALFIPAFVIYMNRFQITAEEGALLAKFGTPFAQYMSKTRRWI